MGKGLIESENFVPISFGIKGLARFVLRDLMGRPVQDTGWFPNVITDTGMIHIRDLSNYRAYIELGTSTGSVSTSDTGCFAPLSPRVFDSSLVDAWSGTSYRYERSYARFGVGVCTGTIAEAAHYPSSTGGVCFNHYRIVDSGGSPTTIVKGADNILDVYYEVRNYPPVSDATGTIDISGVSYDYTLRAARVGQTSYWGYVDAREILSSVSAQLVYDNVIGATTGVPTGTTDQLTSGEGSEVSVLGSGTYYNDVQVQIGLDNGNFGGGMRSIQFRTTNCNWQCQYARTVGGAAIDKDAEKRLRLNYRLSWTRL